MKRIARRPSYVALEVLEQRLLLTNADNLPIGTGNLTDIVGRSGGAWWVMDQQDNAVENSYFNAWARNADWKDVHSADFNGDGLDDVVGRVNGQLWVGVSNGTGFDTSLWAVIDFQPQTIVTADVNGDSAADLLLQKADGSWLLAKSAGTQFQTEFFADWTSTGPLLNALIADLNGDGTDDLVGRSQTGQWWATFGDKSGNWSAAQTVGYWVSSLTWSDVLVADVNHDGTDEIVGRNDTGKIWVADLNTNGQLLNQRWGAWSASVSWHDVLVADVNGDRKDDLVGRTNSGSLWVALSDGTKFTSQLWGAWNPGKIWQDVQVADVNNDGFDDIVGRADGRWWVAESTGAHFVNALWGIWANVEWEDVFVGRFTNSRTLPEADRSRLLAAREFIFDSQLPSGAINGVPYQRIGDPVLIDSYFSAFACQNLLAAHSYAPDPRTESFIESWLAWTGSFLTNQITEVPPRIVGQLDAQLDLAAGYAFDQQDSHDSYSALYIAVAGRFVSTFNRAPSQALLSAVDRCLAALDRCFDQQSGLYFNFMSDAVPAGKVATNYLHDNVEVYQGLYAAYEFYLAANETQKALDVLQKATNLANSMHQFWSSEHQYFAAQYGDVQAGVGWGEQVFAAFGLSTMSALANFENVSPQIKRTLWDRFIGDFGTQLNDTLQSSIFAEEDPTIELVFLAALKSASQDDQACFLDLLRSRMDFFIERMEQLPTEPELQFPQVQRLAHMMAGLLAQSGTNFPDLPSVPLNPNVVLSGFAPSLMTTNDNFDIPLTHHYVPNLNLEKDEVTTIFTGELQEH